MSIKLNINELKDSHLQQIDEELAIEIESSKYAYQKASEYLYPYRQEGENVYVPFAWGNEFSKKQGLRTFRRERSDLPSEEIKFTGELREIQIGVRDEVLPHINRTGTAIISAYPGIGKTCMAIYIASKIRLKTLVISHRIVLINQWAKAICRFCPEAKVQILASKTKKQNASFYVMNASNVSKRPTLDYEDIGFVIVDELHLIMAEGLSSCMKTLNPRYLLGLSATPYREDGLDRLIELYFGANRVYRPLFRKHTVYKIATSFKPKVELTPEKRINWGILLESQASNSARNNMIIRIVQKFPDRVFLILCKRVEQGETLVSLLKQNGEDVTSLIGDQQEYEQSSRILVGTASKTGTGFDHPRLNAMILASDIEAYFIQYLGRCMRTEEGEPLIFDILDDNPILKKHFATRKKIYIEHGGTIRDFSKEFPEFEML